MTPKNIGPSVQSSESELKDIFTLLWKKSWYIVLSGLGTFALSAFYAFVVAKPVFVASALLLPTQSQTSDQLGAAAALFGKKAGGSADVDLYQSLLTSRTVTKNLLVATISNKSDTGKGRKEPLFSILKIDTANSKIVESAVKGLSSSIVVDSKESGAGGLLEIRFMASTPWLAQEIGNAILAIGQEELRIVRIKRSQVILTRLSVAVEQAKAEWDSSAKILTTYRDHNRSIALPEQMLALSRLEIEKQAKEQKYLLVRKEYDLQVLEISKAAPPMMILDSANFPAQKSKPNRPAIMTLGLFIGLLGASVLLIAKNSL